MAGRYHGYLLVCSFTPRPVPPGLKTAVAMRAHVSVIVAARVLTSTPAWPAALGSGDRPSARPSLPAFLCRETRGFPIRHPDCLPQPASQGKQGKYFSLSGGLTGVPQTHVYSKPQNEILFGNRVLQV